MNPFALTSSFARGGLQLFVVTGLLAGLGVAAPGASAQSGSVAVAADLRMASESSDFRRAAESFVSRAMAGDADSTLQMLSRELVGRMGEAAARQALQAQILPFFRQGGETGRSVTITRTTDGSGQQGFAFYMWLQPASAAAPKPFTVYVVAEGGKPVVANIVPGRLVEGRHR